MKKESTKYSIQAAGTLGGVISRMDWFVLSTKRADFKIITTDERKIIAINEQDFPDDFNSELLENGTILDDILMLVEKDKMSELNKINNVSLVTLFIDQNKAENFLRKYGINCDKSEERFFLTEKGEFRPLSLSITGSYIGYDYYLFCINVLFVFLCHRSVSQFIDYSEKRNVLFSEMNAIKEDIYFIENLYDGYRYHIEKRNKFYSNNCVVLSPKPMKFNSEYLVPKHTPLPDFFPDKDIDFIRNDYNLIKDTIDLNIKLNNEHFILNTEEYICNYLSSRMTSIHPAIRHKNNDNNSPLYHIQSTSDIFAVPIYYISLFLCYITNSDNKSYYNKLTKRCVECGNPFIAVHGREKYCNPCKPHIKSILAREAKKNKVQPDSTTEKVGK